MPVQINCTRQRRQREKARRLHSTPRIIQKARTISHSQCARHLDRCVLVCACVAPRRCCQALRVACTASRLRRTFTARVERLGSVDGQLLPIPINLDTVNRLYGLALTSFELDGFFAQHAEAVTHVRTSEDVVVGRVGRELYNKFFRGYTRKQWGLDPSELDASVTARVPTRTNRDDRYFTDTYQAMPLHGYTRLFENLLAHPNIKVMLNTDYREIVHVVPWKHMAYTGPVDAFFDHKHGRLPYRSLHFEHVTQPSPQGREYVLPVGTVNHPNDHGYTRVTEFKHLTGQRHDASSLVYEYPRAEGLARQQQPQ